MDGYNFENNYNTGYTQTNSTPDLQGYQHQPVRCPGKEIIGMVFGINSIAWGGLGLLFSWIPFYGMIFSFIWGGLFGIGCGIVALIMHKQVHEVAEEISGKVDTGKKLAVPGIILGGVGMVVSILVIIFMIAIVGIGAFASATSSYRP